jgi:hypothetical protein
MNFIRKNTEDLLDENVEFVPEAITGKIIVIYGT